MPLRPYLNSKRGGGARYIGNAIQTYLLIGLVIRYFGGLFVSPKSEINLELPQDTSINVSTVAPTATFFEIVLSTQTPYPTYTPQPTYTPSVDWLRGTPTVTRQAFNVYDVNFVFSYYYPPLVAVDESLYGINCHPDNIVRNKFGKAIECKDITASGLKWSEYIIFESKNNFYVGGVAVPFYPQTLSPLYPMGSVLVVESPSTLAGRYLVIDICPACDDYYQDKGVLFLDFVARGLPHGVNFWDLVKVSSVEYPQ
jgi:hypothetical protein